MRKVHPERLTVEGGGLVRRLPVEAGAYEAVYSGMPTRGLGRIGRLVPATGRRETARQRLQSDAPEQVRPDSDRVPG